MIRPWLSRGLLLSVCLLVASSSFATLFVVPDDEEFVRKADAIVSGVVLSAQNEVDESGYVWTVYEFAVDRALKGSLPARETIRIKSPGGATDKKITFVESAAHFKVGDEVLLFLSKQDGVWTPTDLTLGKFRHAQTSRGYSVLVRDSEDIVGWDRDGKVHQEKIRLESEFVQFIQDVVAGRKPERQYQAQASDVLAEPTAAASTRPSTVKTNTAPNPATTYSVSLYGCDGTRYPGRWTTAEMTAGVQFFKNSAQNASGLGDGGVSTIQTALASWTNDCNSLVNIPYGGTSANNPADDGKNMVVFNDPTGKVGGSWTGSGTIAITFSNAGNVETFAGVDFANFTDSDVVFQDGFPGDHAAMNVAMTHELGHAIGLRHADKHFLKVCNVGQGCVISCQQESSCDPNSEECAATAVMTANANSGLGFNLQTWDQHGAEALYPGGSCVSLTAPTNLVATGTNSTTIALTWDTVATATGYEIWRAETVGGAFALAGTSATNAFNDTVTSTTAHVYKVRATAGATTGPFSGTDFATAVSFTDSSLIAGTSIKALHITQLRTAVNALRTLAGLSAASFTDTLAATTQVKRVHIAELRTALDEARAALSASALSYTDSTITSGTTKAKAIHITELRGGLQ